MTGLLDNLDYDTRFDLVVTNAWERWTKNGLHLDNDMITETTKTVQDAATNAYVDDMTNKQWLTATLISLGVA